jgi:hypothetical protein
MIRGDFGRMGHGYSTDLFMPQSISMPKGLEIKQIACSDSHWLAITGDGDVFRYPPFPTPVVKVQISENVLFSSFLRGQPSKDTIILCKKLHPLITFSFHMIAE